MAPAWRQFAERQRGTVYLEVAGRDRCCRDEVLALVEAVLLTAQEPLPPARLAKLARLPDAGEARREVARLADLLRIDNAAFYVEEIAGGYQMRTRTDLRPWMDAIFGSQPEAQLSPSLLETLAIIAYRQPISRADVEAIRGVQVSELIRQLLERELVKLGGRDDSLGRPHLYVTTPKFLEVFGLRNLHELPMIEQLAVPKATNPDSDSMNGSAVGSAG